MRRCIKRRSGRRMTDERIRYGTAEAPKLAKNTIALDKIGHKKSKLKHELKYEVVFGTTITGKSVAEIRKKGFLGEKNTGLRISSKEENVRGLRHIKRNRNQLQHLKEETGRKKLDEGTYKGLIRFYDKEQILSQIRRRRAYKMAKSLYDNENIADDELSADLKSEIKRDYYGTRLSIKGNVRNIHNLNNTYRRISYAKEKEWLLQEQRKKIQGKILRDDYRGRIKSASSQIQKRHLKKELASAIRNEEGRFVRRNLHQAKVKVAATNRIIRNVKRVISTVMSVVSLLIIFIVIFCIGFIIILGFLSGFAEYNEKAVTQNDYGTLSDTTTYLKHLETDLQEYLNNKNQIEAELQSENGGDIYEFHYNLASTGYSNNTLMAYLSAKYGSFNLNQVKGEIEGVFADMYELETEIRTEVRYVVDFTEKDPETGLYPTVEVEKKICYVTLKKSSLESVVEGRMNAEEKERYNTYKMSKGGQQVYGPVMKEDWTNRITSDYGERIHPITGERVFHNGIDIGVPTETPLYSAVKGTVILADYSESAGNYIKIQTDSGWTVIFMHMDSFAVERGQQVERGDLVGYSGNSGRSTGPHLHLEVRDANGNTINPYFIVPQNCYEIERTEE